MSGINTGCVHNDLGVCSDCELARLRAASNTFQSQLTDLQTKLDKAREALRPFAELYNTEYDNPMHCNDAYATVALDDLRLAAKTLDEVK